MDKELKNILSEMRRLMNYNRSQGSVINEQTFQEYIQYDPVKPNEPKKTGKVDKTGWFYDQRFIKPKNADGYFNSDMKLGECFKINVFDSTSNAANSMDFPGIIKDPNPKLGYFIYGDVLNSNNKSEKIRIYLPQDEFFTNLKGKIKSFIAYRTCNEKEKNLYGVKYTLIYQLNNPEKAIINQVITADGVKYIDDDPSRGWGITFFNGTETGYFAESTNDDENYDEPINSFSKVNLLPGQFKEFTSGNYSEEFGKSEFDIIYDSGLGTALQIGGAIIIGIISGGIGTLLTAGMESLIAARAITLGIELGSELLLGIPEAIYLKKRGMNTASTIVLLFSFIPLFNRMKLVTRLAGDMSQEEIQRFTLELANKAKGGEFSSPGDVQKWLNGLDANTRAWAERMIKEGSAALKKLNTKEVQEQLENGLKKLINETKVQNVAKGVAKNVYDKEFSDLIKKINPTTINGLKLAGIDVVATFGSIPLIMTIVKDNEEFIKDPQKILQNASENLNKIAMNFENTKVETLVNEVQKLKSTLDSNPNDMDAARKYVDLSYDLGTLFEKRSMSEIKSEILNRFLLELLNEIKLEYFKAEFNKDVQNQAENLLNKLNSFPTYVMDEFWTNIMCAHCTDLPFTDFKIIDDVCNFIDWVNKTHGTDFKYKNPAGEIDGGLDNCDKRKQVQPNWALMKYDCGVRTAYNLYKTEYEKIKNTTTN